MQFTRKIRGCCALNESSNVVTFSGIAANVTVAFVANGQALKAADRDLAMGKELDLVPQSDSYMRSQ